MFLQRGRLFHNQQLGPPARKAPVYAAVLTKLTWEQGYDDGRGDGRRGERKQDIDEGW